MNLTSGSCTDFRKEVLTKPVLGAGERNEEKRDAFKHGSVETSTSWQKLMEEAKGHPFAVNNWASGGHLF